MSFRKKNGCEYMEPDEQLAFDQMIAPHVFDPSTVKNKVLDIQYGTLPEQKLDLYLPEKHEGLMPVIFDVHGGGWVAGTKLEGFLDGVISALEEGYAVISVDYRLAPGVKFPENLFDVKTAVRWARAHAAEYDFDPTRFGMIGDSAGGHLTLMIGLTAGHPELSGEQYGWAGFSDEVQVICDMFGPSILDQSWDKFYIDSGVVRATFGPQEEDSDDLTGLVFGKDKNLLKIISPISYVHRNMPPTMILHGKKDSLVPYQVSTLLYDRIVEICGTGKAVLKIYDDRNHEDYGFYTNDDLAKTFLPFFNQYLK